MPRRSPLRAPRRARPVCLLVSLALALSPVLPPVVGASAAAAPPDAVRLAGAGRLATAVAVSRATYPAGTRAVVVARADAYADALAGGPLAATLDAPILLTGSGALDPSVAEEVSRLAATTAVILGGAGAVSAAVEDGLRAAGVTRVERLAGRTRFETAAAIAARIGGTKVYVAEGGNPDPARGWPDALAVSALAAAQRRPILLATTAALPDATAAALDELAVDEATIVGGAAAVSDVVAAALSERVSVVSRLAGRSRWETSAAVARAAASVLSPERVWLASGRGWPDALVAGPAAARDGAVLLLVDGADLDASPATRDWLAAHAAERRVLRVVGGTLVVSDAVVAAAASRGSAVPAGERWSDPATWSGRPPREGEVVTIPAGRTVVLDTTPPRLAGLQIDGVLTVADTDLRLEVGWIMVHGRFVAGTADRPLRANVSIVLHPTAGEDVMGMGTGVLGVMGGALELHGQPPAPGWTRLAQTAPAGSTRLVLLTAPAWTPGQRVVIASTDVNPGHAEERTIAAVEGSAVVLDAPLEHTHWGQADVIDGREVEQRAEVGLLSRNLVVRGPADARARGVGGHVMVGGAGMAKISGVEFADMGQRGVLGRYPVHFHLLGASPESYLRDSAIHHSANRCVALHGTHAVHVAGNVAYDAVGHCYFTEDGIEQDNRLEGNLGLVTRAPDDTARLLDSEKTPATFWITNPANAVVGNAAAGSDGFGFWYDLPEHPTGKSATDAVVPRRLPLGIFAGNVAHSNHEIAGFKSGSGLFIDDYRPDVPAHFTDFLAYRNEGFGVWAEKGDVVVEGAVLAENGTGFVGRRATLRDAVVVGRTSNGGDRVWSTRGVGIYDDGATVDGVTFANFPAADGPARAVAIGPIARTSHTPVAVTRARFVNAERIGLTPPWALDEPRMLVVEDHDGSVTGAPATIVSDHPLLAADGCRRVAAWHALVCPQGRSFGLLRLADQGGHEPLGPVTVTAPGGARGPAHADPEWAREPLALVTLPLGHRYAVTLGRPTPERLELVLAGDARGAVSVDVPWPHAEAYAYAGWGEWARPLAATPDQGQVVLPLALEGSTSWARYRLCAVPHCGDGTGTRG